MKRISSSAVSSSERSASGRLAAIEHNDTVGDVEDVVNVVIDENDRAAAGPHLAHEVEDFAVSASESAVVGSSRMTRSARL